MDAIALGGLLEARAAAEEGSDRKDVLYAPGEPERRYDASRLLADCRKTGNFLRQLGVGPGHRVVIADRPAPQSVLSLFGTALLGGSVQYRPLERGSADDTGSEASEVIDARVLIGPTDALGTISTAPATKRLAYGIAPDDPEVAYFERDVWSENPTFPPSDGGTETIAIATERTEYTHREVLAAVEGLLEGGELDPGTEIAVRAPLADPRTVVAGVLAPIACGGTIVLPDRETPGDIAVVTTNKEVPEPATIDLADVSLGPVGR